MVQVFFTWTMTAIRVECGLKMAQVKKTPYGSSVLHLDHGPAMAKIAQVKNTCAIGVLKMAQVKKT